MQSIWISGLELHMSGQEECVPQGVGMLRWHGSASTISLMLLLALTLIAIIVHLFTAADPYACSFDKDGEGQQNTCRQHSTYSSLK
jgi:hypothetical protein